VNGVREKVRNGGTKEMGMGHDEPAGSPILLNKPPVPDDCSSSLGSFVLGMWSCCSWSFAMVASTFTGTCGVCMSLRAVRWWC
jgi:hypothetical protein